MLVEDLVVEELLLVEDRVVEELLLVEDLVRRASVVGSSPVSLHQRRRQFVISSGSPNVEDLLKVLYLGFNFTGVVISWHGW